MGSGEGVIGERRSHSGGEKATAETRRARRAAEATKVSGSDHPESQGFDATEVLWNHGRKKSHGFGDAFLVALGLVLDLGLPTIASAHPIHVTIAEAEFNPETRRVEVALRIFPGDLERALRRHTRRRIELDETPEIDTLIREYLDRVFFLADADGGRSSLVWVGKEIGVQRGWLYFELPAPAGLAGTRLENRVFFELEKDQLNTVILKAPGGRQTFHFSRLAPTHAVGLDAPPVEIERQKLEGHLERARASSDPRGVVRALIDLALFETETGDLPAARKHLLASTSRGKELDSLPLALRALEAAARLAAVSGHLDRACEFEGALHLRRVAREEKPAPPGPRAEALRALLGTDRFGSAWARGQKRAAQPWDEIGRYVKEHARE